MTYDQFTNSMLIACKASPIIDKDDRKTGVRAIYRFDLEEKELIEKDVIEFVARFLDKQQTTLSMENRDLGMFKALKLYENIDYVIEVEDFVQEVLDQLKVETIYDKL